MVKMQVIAKQKIENGGLFLIKKSLNLEESFTKNTTNLSNFIVTQATCAIGVVKFTLGARRFKNLV